MSTKDFEDTEKSSDVVVHSDESRKADEAELINNIDEKRLLRKIDFTLIPWLSLLYLLCFLDRVGIGNARVTIFLLLVGLRHANSGFSCMAWRTI